MNHMAASFKERCVGRRDRCEVVQKKWVPNMGGTFATGSRQEADTVVSSLRVAPGDESDRDSLRFTLPGSIILVAERTMVYATLLFTLVIAR